MENEGRVDALRTAGEKVADTIASMDPRTAAELNDWVRRNFTAFTGPARAYFELPMMHGKGHVIRDGKGQIVKNWRWAYITVALIGEESWCVSAMRGRLGSLATVEEMQDASIPVFVRRWFEYSPPVYSDSAFDVGIREIGQPKKWDLIPGRLTARLAFWDPVLTAKLPYFKDGQGTVHDPLVTSS